MNAAAPFCAFLFSAGLTSYLKHPTAVWRVIDRPNPRSLHDAPKPRSGGIAILLSAAAILAWQATDFKEHSDLLWLAISILPAVGVSLIDDICGVPPGLRLLFHALSALILISGGWMISGDIWPSVAWAGPVWLNVVLTGLFIIWLMNLYNFMDGADGLAAGMGAIGFAAMAISADTALDPIFVQTAWTLSAACGGFLLFNIPPARIFMGDVGSVPLGFLVAAMMLWGARSAGLPLWASGLIFSPFILDATQTLFRRILGQERIWEAHREHHYQYLIRSGWSHRRLAVFEYLLMAGLSLSAYALTRSSSQAATLGLALWTIAFIGLSIWIRFKKHPPSPLD
jgi:UDP-N-acetylmuramyl pentapeptide phosphotransferase/UDP-N-acetylglucosamine-1-phosphate transferase